MAPVIVTGSQIPLAELRSDGQANLLNALHIAASAYSSSNNALLRTRMPNMKLHSDSYSDPEKLAAWSEFYTLPKRCRSKGMQSSDFVWCSEYRGEQKRLFEAQWNKRR